MTRFIRPKPSLLNRLWSIGWLVLVGLFLLWAISGLTAGIISTWAAII